MRKAVGKDDDSELGSGVDPIPDNESGSESECDYRAESAIWAVVNTKIVWEGNYREKWHTT